MVADFHLHTSVSDGELDPAALVACAAAHGIRSLAITDHDTLFAYRWRDGAVFEAARRLGVELRVGIEMDVVLDGREVHLLGLGLRLDAPRLCAHLEAARQARRERARADLAVVQERLWLHVEILDEVCGNQDPRVIDTGWVPAQSPAGTQWAWFWSRGC